jgi:glutaminyl-tRNA synthetase
MTSREPDRAPEAGPNFIYEIIEQDLADGRLQSGGVRTRFPPEPNGYLHIGHAKAICTDFGAARRYGGLCNLRFDDTNPSKEEQEFVDAIIEDIQWLGFDCRDRVFYASDYFEQLYQWAERLIEQGKAYVDESSAEQMREARGDFHRPGRPSPYRDRPAAESLALFRRMRAGELPEGAMVLRAKIDMQSGNLNLRDPAMYRILHAHHQRTGDTWRIYPMYDYAHGQSDALEGITHSLCTLEYEAHRPLYEWFLEALELPHRPRQIEFAPLSLDYTVLSKRILRRIVETGLVQGWDDPRMPTLAGMRRRGFTPEAIVAFVERIGVSKREGSVDISLFEFLQREDLNARAPRVMAVLDPLKVVITNYPEGAEEEFSALNHPEYPERGSRLLPFGRELYIEREDFREDSPKKWFRLSPGREVRLRAACLITCDEVIKDADGKVVELRCHWDPESRGGNAADGRKVKGTLHWVSAKHALDATVRLYDRLFAAKDPYAVAEGGDVVDNLNPASLTVLTGCKLEPSLASAQPLHAVQFERLGYFIVDPDSRPGALLFNRTLSLRDSWAKLEGGAGEG